MASAWKRRMKRQSRVRIEYGRNGQRKRGCDCRKYATKGKDGKEERQKGRKGRGRGREIIGRFGVGWFRRFGE